MESGLLGSGGDVETKGSPLEKVACIMAADVMLKWCLAKSQNQCEAAGVLQSSKLVFLLFYIIQGSVAPVGNNIS